LRWLGGDFLQGEMAAAARFVRNIQDTGAAITG